jgi:hypothetical protein
MSLAVYIMPQKPTCAEVLSVILLLRRLEGQEVGFLLSFGLL